VTVPTSLDEALGALRDDPEAQVLAGGTDLMVEVNFGHRRPASVVALHRVTALRGIDHDAAAGRIRIGAGTTWTDLLAEPIVSAAPALAEAARTVGSPQIRNAGTIGGNLGTCSPAGDGLPVLSALDAEVELRSSAGVRTMSIHEFMVGVKRTARRPGELITAVTVPVLDGPQGYAKVGVRNAMVISAAGACLALDRRGRSVRLALGAVGPTILRAREAEDWLAATLDWDDRSASLGGGVAEEFGRRAAAAARPIDDHRATAEYRRHAVGVLATRLLRRAFP
jgi:CO/xanthine dehydrogenase FAD-binding subunit